MLIGTTSASTHPCWGAEATRSRIRSFRQLRNRPSNATNQFRNLPNLIPHALMVLFRIIVVAARLTWKSVKFAPIHGFLNPPQS